MTRMVFSGDDILKRLLFSIVPCTGLLVIDSINLIVLSLNKALYIGIHRILSCASFYSYVYRHVSRALSRRSDTRQNQNDEATKLNNRKIKSLNNRKIKSL